MTTRILPRPIQHAPGRNGVRPLPTLRLVRPPTGARRLARLVLGVFLLLPFALLFVPWQQSLSGTGKVVAFDPADRQQVLEAPIEGRIHQWHVREGSQVRQGDLLVSLRDPDPNLTVRLGEERQAVEQRLQRARDRAQSLEGQIGSLRLSKEQALTAARNRQQMAQRQLESAKQQETAAQAVSKLARYDLESMEPLQSQGLVSGLDYQRAVQRKVDAGAKVVSAEQTTLAAENLVLAQSADLTKVGNDADAAIQSVQALEQSAEADVAASERDLAQIKCRQARQETQEVRAPADGTIFRVLANAHQGGMLVKAGDPLAILVPTVNDETERTVELFVDGNDMPLITEYIKHQQAEHPDRPPQVPVRLQFEGWPAVQFVGWPSVAVGTFGGQVQLVDATDDGKGKFRLLVRPDPEEELTNPWPKDYSLRQGVRANGWVLLNRVSLGWELWRRLNGFPPVVAGEDPDKDKDASKKLKVIK